MYQKSKRKMLTRLLWGGLEGLKGPKLKQKLLERMADSEAALEKFWQYATIKTEDECWPYRVHENQRYGIFSIIAPAPNRKTVTFQAHRISYFIAHRSLPENCYICHHCDNMKCVNPKHLFLGDKYINMIDRDNKNRQAKGESITLHKLTEAEVVWARKNYIPGVNNYTELGKALKVSYHTISRAVNRRTWKHVK